VKFILLVEKGKRSSFSIRIRIYRMRYPGITEEDVLKFVPQFKAKLTFRAISQKMCWRISVSKLNLIYIKLTAMMRELITHEKTHADIPHTNK